MLFCSESELKDNKKHNALSFPTFPNPSTPGFAKSMSSLLPSVSDISQLLQSIHTTTNRVNLPQRLCKIKSDISSLTLYNYFSPCYIIPSCRNGHTDLLGTIQVNYDQRHLKRHTFAIHPNVYAQGTAMRMQN